MTKDKLQNRMIGAAFLALAAGLGFLAAFGAPALTIAAAVGAGMAGGIGALFTVASLPNPAAGDDAQVAVPKQAELVAPAQEKALAPEPVLSNAQIVPLLDAVPQLEQEVEPLLSPELKHKLVDLEKRAGEKFNEGQWRDPQGRVVQTNPPAAHPPTREEAQAILGGAYLEVSCHHHEGATHCLAVLMGAMELTRSAPVRAGNVEGPRLSA